MYTTKYNPGGVRQFNLTTRRNGVRTPNYSYKVTRPYTPRALPNIASQLPSRYAPGREQKYFYTHQPINASFNVNGNQAAWAKAGFFIPLLERESATSTYHRIEQGASPSQRIGLKVAIKKIKLQGSLIIGSHSSDKHGSRGRYRMMVVQDLQANGVVLTAAANTAQLLHAANIDSPLNPIYSSKFKVLWDKTFTPNGIFTGWTPDIAIGADNYYAFTGKAMQFEITLKNTILLTYQGSTGALTELVNNNLYIFCIAETDGTASIGKDRCTPTLYYQGMIYYDDN